MSIQDVDDVQIEFEQQYFDIIGKADDILEQITLAKARMENLDRSGAGNVVNKSYLWPKLNVPCFSGAYEEWTQFYEMFTCMCNNSPGISKIEKFVELKTYLKGDALRVRKFGDYNAKL